MQILGLACASVAMWHSRKTVQLGIDRFELDWSLLITAAMQDPVQELRNPILQDTFLKVQCENALACPPIATYLKKSQLQKSYPADALDTDSKVLKCLSDYIATIMSKSKSQKQAKTSTGSILSDKDTKTEFAESIVEQVYLLDTIVEPPSFTFEVSKLAALRSARDRLSNEKDNINAILQPLFEFPELGKVFKEEFFRFVKDFESAKECKERRA